MIEPKFARAALLRLIGYVATARALTMVLADSLAAPALAQGESRSARRRAALCQFDVMEEPMKKMRSLRAAVVSIAAMFPAGPAWAQATSDGGYPCGAHMMWWNGGWSGMMFGPLLMILVPLVLVFAVLIALRRFGPTAQGPSSASPQSPLDILKERFARGEIDKEEFDARRGVLDE